MMDELSRYLAGGGAGRPPSDVSPDPNLFQRFFSSEAGQRAAEAGRKAKETGMKAVSAAGRRPGMAGTLGATALLAGGNLLQQDPLGAVTSTLGGLAGGGVGAGIAKLIPGPAGKVAQFALPTVGALLGGMGTEAVGSKAAEYVGARVPGAPEIAQRSQEQRTREFEREQQRLDYQARSQAEFAQNKELLGYLMTQSVEQSKAMLPIQKDLMRQQLINQQTLNASNAAHYQQMGRTATMGRAALANIAEAGATTRTLLSQNPYSGSVLQAPSISFG